MIVPHNLVPPLLLCLHYFPLTLLIYCNLGFASSDYLETELLKVTIPLKNKTNKQKTLVALCQSDFPHHKVFNTQEETLTLSSALAFVALFHCGLPTSLTAVFFIGHSFSFHWQLRVSPNFYHWLPPTSSTISSLAISSTSLIASTTTFM